MESQPLTYIPHKSKKRVFPGGTSSYVDPDVVEITPPVTWSAKSSSRSRSRSLKQKEVIQHEIIDVDVDDDCGEVILVGEKINSNNKGKEAMVEYSAQKGSADGVDSLMKNSAQGLDSVGSDFSFNNDYMDIYYDDFVFDDDYTMLQSQYDNMDIPSGVEAPIPWLSQNPSTRATEPLTQLVSSSSRSSINLNSGFVSEFAQGKKIKGGSNYNPTYSSSSVPKPSIPSANSESLHGIWKSEVSSSSTNNSNCYPIMPHPTSVYKKKRRHAGIITSLHSTSHYLPMNTGSNFSTSAKTPSIPNYAQNLASTVPNYLDYLGGSPFPSVHYPFTTKARTSKGRQDLSGIVYKYGNEEEILKKFQGFKKFDTVEDHSDHHYVKSNLSAKPQSKNWAKKIQDEWRILEKDLPDSIFVRVYESRMDLLRAVIIGAEGTPYHDGLFFFDVFFPSSYPSVPPHVHYHSGGLRINPNLYNEGKVCLSLLNTWSGGQKEKWLPGVSTMLQVLVSIQGLILNAKPYFNEPGYAHSSGSPAGEQSSAKYNEDTLIKSLTTMVYSIRRPPKYFEDLVAGHFLTRGHDILVACKAYMDGAQVGCLVRGGVQDVDEGDKSCSREFKQTLSNQISIIVGAFKNIGLKNCDKFLPPSK